MKIVTKYTLDEKTHNEFVKGYENNLTIFCFIILIMTIISSLLLSDFGYAIRMIIFVLIWSIIIIGINKYNKKILYNRLLLNNKGKVRNDTLTLDCESIKGKESNGNKGEYNYSDIIAIKETENLLILKLKYKLGLIINKNNLKGANVDEAKEFLLNKCINLKSKKIKTNKINKLQLVVLSILFVILIIFPLIVIILK